MQFQSNRAFGAFQRIWIGAAIAALPALGFAVFHRPDLEKVPVQRLLDNLERQAQDAPDDPLLQQNLARVHGMAYTQKSDELPVEKNSPRLPWFGFIPRHVPFGKVVELDQPSAEEQQLPAAELKRRRADAAKHLEQSIVHYRRAVELDPENLTAALGLAWTLDQAGNDEEAMTRYRAVIERGWATEKEMTVAGLQFQSLVREGAEYLLPHLDETKDQTEIADLKEKVAAVQKIRRPVTPLAIPLGAAQAYQDVYDPAAAVPFDADGSGVLRPWTWIRPTAAWLVYDPAGDGQVDSALQLFGSVTFWCFWRNGFDALSALDDNGDGVLTHRELRALALWQDANQNGRTEPGEVQPLAAHSIALIHCDHRSLATGDGTIEFHPAGMVRLDGRSVPVYDLWLQPVDPAPLTGWPFRTQIITQE